MNRSVTCMGKAFICNLRENFSLDLGLPFLMKVFNFKYCIVSQIMNCIKYLSPLNIATALWIYVDL